MTNKERIQANNAKLRDCIDIAENLPDAGEGGTPTPTQEKTIDIKTNGTYTVTPDEGHTLSKVTANVNVPIPEGYIVPSGTLDVTENGTHDVTAYASVNVNVVGDTDIEDGLITRTLTEYTNDRVTSVADYFFYKAQLQTVSLSNVKTLGTYAFWNSSLVSVDLPSLTTISGSQVFYACRSLKTINMPALVSITGGHCFYNCTVLETADFPMLTSIGQQAFATSKISTLILRANTICTLANINAFTSTPIASGNGYIYVPAALVDGYKVATNWSTLATQFRALEEYTVDGTITGALDPNKI